MAGCPQNKHRRTMRNDTVLATGLGLLVAVQVPAASTHERVLLPWHDKTAARRRVIRVNTTVPRTGPVARFALQGSGKAPLRVVAADRPNAALPIFRRPDGTIAVHVPGQVATKRPRLLLAYESTNPSPQLAGEPDDTDDYATATYGDAWDFDEGDQDHIRQWGDRRHHYGEVTVRDGRLVIPVTGSDPYFIWGVMFGHPDAKTSGVEHIDSTRYTTLAMRVRQTRTTCRWTLYVTDHSGVYRHHDFVVAGPEWQTLRLDLAELFPDLWDGREFRALRIDPTNDAAGTTVEIDWVRLLPAAATTTVGPVLSREHVEARTAVRRIRCSLPEQAQAGMRPTVTITPLDAQGRPVPHAPLALALDSRRPLVLTADGKGAARAAFDVGTRAGTYAWTAGVCDDLGHAVPPHETGPITIAPGPLTRYELVAETRFVRVDRPTVRVGVWGQDAFGNRRSVDLAAPKWHLTGGATVTAGALSGAPAAVTVTCARRPLVRHEIRLTDSRGRRGRLEVTTMALKRAPITVGPNGYLVDAAGELFLPLGGFYANWPTAPPDARGGTARSVDLFPCGPEPYPHGFPWPDEVERKVAQYLQLCHRHGVTALRLMLRNMDLVGRVDPVQLEAVLHLFDLARPLDIRFNVVLFEDYDKPPYGNAEILEKIVLPRYTPAALADLPPHRRRFLVEKRLLPQPALRYTDPDAIACQKDYLAELLVHLAPREEVFCYEFENEMVHTPMSWVNEMTAYIRTIDPRTLILGNPGPHRWPEPSRWREGRMDLFSYHPYSDGQPDADHGAVVFMRSKWAATCGKPFFSGEGGVNQNRWQPNVRKVPQPYATRGVRDQIWLSLCCGANGAFMWTPSHEHEVAEFGKVRPALRAIGVDLRTIRRRKPETNVTMPDDASANAKACALAWRLLDAGVDFDALPASQSSGDRDRIDAADVDPKTVAPSPRLLKPAKGYQLAYLAAGDGTQILVYLRNVAGGIVNLGNGRACHVREPKPAVARVESAAPAGWRNAKAYDLDEAKPVPVTVEREGRAFLLFKATCHDYVIALRR